MAVYLPHIWEDAAKAREVFAALLSAQSLGPKSFHRKHFFDLIEGAGKARLKLKSTNPEEHVFLRLMAGDMRQRMGLLHHCLRGEKAIQIGRPTFIRFHVRPLYLQIFDRCFR